MDTSFFKKLLSYRDVILLVLFFLGGLGWIYRTFATKCFVDANLEAYQILLEQESASSGLGDLRLEINNLENLQATVRLNDKQVQQLNDLREEYQKMAEAKSDSLRKLNEAYKKCTL